MKKLFVACLVCATLALGLISCGGQSQSQPQQQQQSQQTQQSQQNQQNVEDEFGTVKPESAEVLVAKFNTQVMDNSHGAMNPASIDFLTEMDDMYWYGLIEGVYLVVIPEEFTGNQTNDIVDTIMIYVDKTTEFENLVPTYTTYLIVANNPEITADEAAALMNEAKEIADTKNTAISGKGITVGYFETDDMYQYQVIRVNQ